MRSNWSSPRLDTSLKRATYPVLAGLAAIAVIFGIVWLLAWWQARNLDISDARFQPGPVRLLAERIAEDGQPIVFPAAEGTKSLAIWHEGSDVDTGWHTYTVNSPDLSCDKLLQFDDGELVDQCTAARYPLTGKGLAQFDWEVTLNGTLSINPRLDAASR
jgi:hypothetical protein